MTVATMIEKRIETIRSMIESTRHIPSKTKAELLNSLASLKSEVSALAETHHEAASSITHFADAAAHEASRAQKNPQLVETALHGLRISVQEFESSHPTLVSRVSGFATTLSNLGI